MGVVLTPLIHLVEFAPDIGIDCHRHIFSTFASVWDAASNIPYKYAIKHSVKRTFYTKEYPIKDKYAIQHPALITGLACVCF